jgi:GNAT superfamily N-acetyltransferase
MLEEFGGPIERGQVYALGQREGVIVLVPHRDHLFVRDVAVDPGSQGGGLGRRLMRFAEIRAAELGLREIRLVTNVAMVENRRFYARIGYEDRGPVDEDGYRRVRFRKVLVAAAGGGDEPPA